jgi:hypothetical protein
MTQAIEKQELMNPGELKTIKVTKPTYDRIAKEITFYGETMDKILSRLLDEVEECRKKSKAAGKP